MRVPKFLNLFLFLLLLPAAALAGVHAGRIISLGPVFTEEIYLLGAESNLTGVTIYCERPESARLKEKIGNLIEINIEKIVSLKPDLVIASGMSDPKRLKKLEKLGIQVVVFEQPRSYDEICSQFLQLSAFVNKTNEAIKIIKNSKARVESAARKASQYQTKRVFVEIGTNPLFTIPDQSFISDFLLYANCSNSAPKAGSGLYSFEKAVASMPDVILISDMGKSGDADFHFWKRASDVPAVKNKHIYSINSYDLCSPTPKSFPVTLEKIIELVHSQKDRR